MMRVVSAPSPGQLVKLDRSNVAGRFFWSNEAQVRAIKILRIFKLIRILKLGRHSRCVRVSPSFSEFLRVSPRLAVSQGFSEFV